MFAYFFFSFDTVFLFSFSLFVTNMYLFMGTCKVWSEIETKRNRTKRNEIKQNETKPNETKRNVTSFRFVSIDFVSFRLISFRFVRFRFVSFRLYFVPHFTGTRSRLYRFGNFIYKLSRTVFLCFWYKKWLTMFLLKREDFSQSSLIEGWSPEMKDDWETSSSFKKHL